PRDPNQLAKLIVDIATGEVEDSVSESKRHPSKRRAGGLKGGTARAKRLTPQEREDIARIASRARWKKAD
ncbi:MAG: histone H1, partial [Rhabdochlamydiaceae bacterium]